MQPQHLRMVQQAEHLLLPLPLHFGAFALHRLRPVDLEHQGLAAFVAGRMDQGRFRLVNQPAHLVAGLFVNNEQAALLGPDHPIGRVGVHGVGLQAGSPSSSRIREALAALTGRIDSRLPGRTTVSSSTLNCSRS